MTWQIPSHTLRLLDKAPRDRPVLLLLRHSVRDDLPQESDEAYALPITDTGYQLAADLGNLLRGRVRTLHSSPLTRCIQTAEAIAEGAQATVDVVPDRLLGDPGSVRAGRTTCMEQLADTWS